VAGGESDTPRASSAGDCRDGERFVTGDRFRFLSSPAGRCECALSMLNPA
jgi:hypothetical protein